MNPFINFLLYYSVPNQHFLSAMGRSAKELGVSTTEAASTVVDDVHELNPSHESRQNEHQPHSRSCPYGDCLL